MNNNIKSKKLKIFRTEVLNNKIQYRFKIKFKLKFSRFLKNKFKYNPSNKDIRLNCHDGQRKLLFSEIEFYTLIQNKYNLNELLVVYIGSADGTHEPIIFDMFPDLDFYFVDPGKFNIKHKYIHNKNKLIIKNEYYSNKIYKDILKLSKSKNKKIIFISDVRGDNLNEESILNDMMKQKEYCIQLNPVAFMLKLRLPWSSDMKYIEYLDGKIYTQILAPNHSTETRLINIECHNKFKLKKYNIVSYENQCYYFNLIYRRNYFVYRYSYKLQKYIAGFDDSHACCTMYYIINNYVKKNSNSSLLKNIINNRKLKIYEKVIILLNYVDKTLNNLTNKKILMCNMKEFLSKYNKSNKIFTNYCITYLESINNQIILIKNNINNDNLFSNKHYKNEINILKNESKILKKRLNELNIV